MFISFFIILIELINKMFSLSSGSWSAIAAFLLVIVTILLVIVTFLLKKTADNQLTAGLTAQFQDAWLNKETRFRRNYLRDREFLDAFDEAIKEVYGKPSATQLSWISYIRMEVK